jgi:hypothetical protein
VELEVKFQRSNRALQLKFAELRKKHSAATSSGPADVEEHEL